MKFTFFSVFFCIHTDSYISGKLTNEMNSVFFKLVKKIPRKLVVLLYCQICIGMFLKLIELLGIWCEKEQNSTETKISLSQYEIQPDTVHMPGVYTFTIYRIQFFFRFIVVRHANKQHFAQNHFQKYLTSANK